MRLIVTLRVDSNLVTPLARARSDKCTVRPPHDAETRGLLTELCRCIELGYGRDCCHKGDTAEQHSEERDWADHGASHRTVHATACVLNDVLQSEIDLLKNLNVRGAPPYTAVVSHAP